MALGGVIASLSSEHTSPLFQPHITLHSLPSSTSISPDAILPPKSELPSSIPIKFNKVCTGKTFFQSVLIELQLTEGDELDRLHRQVVDRNRAAFEISSGGSGDKTILNPSLPYYPHISLFYGNPSMEVKEEIVKSLIARYVATLTGSDPPVAVAGVTSFEVVSIWIVRTDGPVEIWEVLKKVALDEGRE